MQRLAVGLGIGLLLLLIGGHPARGDGRSGRVAGRIDVDLAGGRHIGGWRHGWTNPAPGESRVSGWSQTIPAAGSVIGNNLFTLFARDVTPPPYNQPPYHPSGGVDSVYCTVVGLAP